MDVVVHMSMFSHCHIVTSSHSPLLHLFTSTSPSKSPLSYPQHNHTPSSTHLPLTFALLPPSPRSPSSPPQPILSYTPPLHLHLFISTLVLHPPIRHLFIFSFYTPFPLNVSKFPNQISETRMEYELTRGYSRM